MKLKAFKILVRVGFLKLSKYVEASFVNIISSLVYIMVQYYVWKSIVCYSSVRYTFYEMFSYILFSQILTVLYPSALGKQLGKLISSGDISYTLLKPMSFVKQLVYENIGVSLYKLIFIALPIFAVGSVISNFSLCLGRWIAFVIASLLSYIIYIYIDLLFGILQFYTSASWGVQSLKYAVITLLSGRVLPIVFYPEWGKRAISILPFQCLYDYPLKVLIEDESLFHVIFLETAWVFLLMFLFHVVYRRVIKHIVVFGG